MAITRTPWTDDDGTGTTGTIINNAEQTLPYNQIDAALVTGAHSVNVITTAGANLDLTTAAGSIRLITLYGPSGVRSIAYGNHGDLLVIQNTSTTIVDLIHGNATGTLSNWVTSAPTRLAQNGAAIYRCDNGPGPWRLISHEQGAWITEPFNAANF